MYAVDRFEIIAVAAAILLSSSDSRVKKMGSPSFKEREAATRSLIESGHSARLPVKLATRNPDPEIRSRAERVWQHIKPVTTAYWVRCSFSDDPYVYWTEFELNRMYPGVTHFLIDAFPGVPSGSLVVYRDTKEVFAGPVASEFLMSADDPKIIHALYPD